MADEYEEESNVIDLMQVLKDRLQGRQPTASASPPTERQEAAESDAALDKRSKSELYELAQELDIAGRSNMSKQQLVDAIRRH